MNIFDFSGVFSYVPKEEVYLALVVILIMLVVALASRISITKPRTKYYNTVLGIFE